MDPSVEMTTLGKTLVSLASQSLVTNALPKLAGTGCRGAPEPACEVSVGYQKIHK
jgi:hypothetical protein